MTRAGGEHKDMTREEVRITVDVCREGPKLKPLAILGRSAKTSQGVTIGRSMKTDQSPY